MATNVFKNGTSVRFKTSRMRRPMKGKVVGKDDGPHGAWLRVKDDDGTVRKVRAGSCTAA